MSFRESEGGSVPSHAVKSEAALTSLHRAWCTQIAIFPAAAGVCMGAYVYVTYRRVRMSIETCTYVDRDSSCECVVCHVVWLYTQQTCGCAGVCASFLNLRIPPVIRKIKLSSACKMSSAAHVCGLDVPFRRLRSAMLSLFPP